MYGNELHTFAKEFSSSFALTAAIHPLNNDKTIEFKMYLYLFDSKFIFHTRTLEVD